MSLDLVARWWNDVHADRVSPRGYAHGDQGVSLLLDHLGQTLSDDHVAARDLLVRNKLDVDVLIAGPSGVWVLEVKHWSGQIVCRHGDWWRERTYFAAGGIETTETDVLRPFDRQWLREVEAVTQTLSRRLKPPVPAAMSIRGGLVFSHPEASPIIDSSCKAAYGSPEVWVARISREPPLAGFDTRQRLRVLDALFAWGRKLERSDSAGCAERLAARLHEQASDAAANYIRRLQSS